MKIYVNFSIEPLKGWEVLICINWTLGSLFFRPPHPSIKCYWGVHCKHWLQNFEIYLCLKLLLVNSVQRLLKLCLWLDKLGWEVKMIAELKHWTWRCNWFNFNIQDVSWDPGLYHWWSAPFFVIVFPSMYAIFSTIVW